MPGNGLASIITSASASHFGLFKGFQAAAAAGTLPPYTFLEPSWGSTGNSQHPNYDVALGEQLIHDVYEALRSGPGWPQTLLVITYDEHGGCYDHVPPPWGATPPDNTAGEYGFGDVLTLTAPRTDDVLAGVTVPAAGSVGPAAGTLSHLEAIREDLATRFSPDARPESKP